MNCISESVLNGSTAVVCYRLEFDLPLASGAAYGLFKLIALAARLTSLLMLRLVKKRKIQTRWGIFRVLVAFEFIGLGLYIGIAVGLPHLGGKFASKTIEEIVF